MYWKIRHINVTPHLALSLARPLCLLWWSRATRRLSRGKHFQHTCCCYRPQIGWFFHKEKYFQFLTATISTQLHAGLPAYDRWPSVFPCPTVFSSVWPCSQNRPWLYSETSQNRTKVWLCSKTGFSLQPPLSTVVAWYVGKPVVICRPVSARQVWPLSIVVAYYEVFICQLSSSSRSLLSVCQVKDSGLVVVRKCDLSRVVAWYLGIATNCHTVAELCWQFIECNLKKIPYNFSKFSVSLSIGDTGFFY